MTLAAEGARRGPLDPRLLRRGRATLAYLVAGVAVGSLTAVLTIVQAWALASALGTIFETHTLGVLGWALPTLVAVFTGKAVLAWLNQWLAHRAAAAVKSRLRRDVLAARLADPVAAEPSTASLVQLLTQGLEDDKTQPSTATVKVSLPLQPDGLNLPTWLYDTINCGITKNCVEAF